MHLSHDTALLSVQMFEAPKQKYIVALIVSVVNLAIQHYSSDNDKNKPWHQS